MAVNHYFQGGRGIGNDSEKRLHEDIIIESLKIFGQDIYYLPRTLVNRDLVLGEDTSSRFDDSYLLEMYFETTEGFAGENEIIKDGPTGVQYILDAQLSLLAQEKEILAQSDEKNDEGTNALMSNLIGEKEKLNWMFKSWLEH